MKNISKLLFVLLTFTIISFNAFSQETEEAKIMDIPNLTTEQKTQIKELKQTRLENRKTLKTDKKALVDELKVLIVAKEPNEDEINAKIDEISEKRAEIFKQTVEMHLDIKALLTDEQKTWYDENILSKFLTREKE